jgi:hypothetical protein
MLANPMRTANHRNSKRSLGLEPKLIAREAAPNSGSSISISAPYATIWLMHPRGHIRPHDESKSTLPTWLPSFVQLCRPVQDDRHRLGLPLFYWRDDQKSLAVLAHVINEKVINWDWLPWAGLEKCDWRAGIEIGPVVTGVAIILPSEDR